MADPDPTRNSPAEAAFQVARGAALWIEDRLHVAKMWNATAGHLIPQSSASWFYVFGSGTLLCFMIQVVTGILLALIYQPTGADAYQSLEYLTYVAPLGWFLRGVHFWGSNAMVTIMLLHMTQVFLFGAFKYPRELTWITGVLLMLAVFGMAFTGQVLRFDQDAYWGLGIGVAIVGRVPFIGPELVHMMLGGPIIGGETLSRFFTLHVFIIPGSILAIVSFHLRLVLAKGINEYPKPGEKVDKATYVEDYEKKVHKEGVPFFPHAAWKDMIFAAFVIGAICALALVFGPKIPNGVPDPTLIDTNPRPDFFFLWIFGAASLLPPWTETVLLLTAPVVGIAFLLALPFLFNTGEKHWSRRPMSVLGVILVFLVTGVLTYFGITSPWSPVMDAWTSEPTPTRFLQGRSPLEMQGALVLQTKQCRNCHALEGIGGKRGPDLDGVANRLTRDQLIRQVIQGGGNMPAYGRNLSPDEVTALVAFLETLHPKGTPPARDSSIPEKPAVAAAR